jgi:hypothetical protein
MRKNRPAAVLLMSRKHLDKVGKMEENWTENEHQKGFVFLRMLFNNNVNT